jgi:AcrR family transcriptional regulator
MKGSRKEQRAETRSRLFAAAVTEFQRAGVAGAQIDRIAQAAGVVRGTFYFHFPTKEHVLLELQHRHETRLLARLEGLPPDASLAAVLDTVAASIRDDEAWDRTPGLMREMVAMYARQPRLDRLYERSDPLERELARRFTAAAARGELRAGVDPVRLGVAFLTSLLGMLLSSANEPRRRRRALATLIDVFAAGASRRPPAAPRGKRRVAR